MDLTEDVAKMEIIEELKPSDKAFNLKLPDGIYWLPKSQCRITGKFVYIPVWLANEKEIEYLETDVE